MKKWMQLALTGALLAPSAAFAGDDEAMAKLREAYGHWYDEDPAECLRLAEEAWEAEPEDQVLRMQILQFTGSIHHVKTGDLDEAVEYYDQIIRALAGVQDSRLRQIKADVMVRKGNIIYSEHDDAQGALRMYMSAHQTWPLSTTAEICSQFCYRMGRNEQLHERDRATNLELAERLAREAIELAPNQFQEEAARAPWLNKYRLQLTLVLTARGNAEEAAATYEEINFNALTENSLYQQAVYQALQDNPEMAADCLRQFMATRPNAQTRNQLRKFIRTEPDFSDYVGGNDWNDLTDDEPVE